MPSPTRISRSGTATTANLGFLLAKASSRWNQLLAAAFNERGFPEVRPSYGSILLPLFERDGLRIGDLTAAARQPKQTTTTLIRQLERDGLVYRMRDADDARSWRVYLTSRGLAFRPVAEDVLASLDARVEEHLTDASGVAVRGALRALMEL